MKPLKIYNRWRNSLRSSDGRVRYHNFWDGETADEIWFTGFLQSRGLLKKYTKAHFVFFSALGSVMLLRVDELLHPFCSNRKRIFFSGENINHPVFKDYHDNLINRPSVDLSLGFDFIDSQCYLRFPIWLLEMFPPQSTVEDIRCICNSLSHQQLESFRNRFCALVSGTSTWLGTDSLKMRTHMVQQLNAIAPVDCAGKLLHNTDELKERFGDNKVEYLKRYRFYICPENASVEGYVTEKLFHCIGSGCIPIYWGACGNPEPDVLNRDAILFWNPDGDNEALLKQIAELEGNSALYRDFFEQPRLKDDAWQIIVNYFESLEQHLNNLFQ